MTIILGNLINKLSTLFRKSQWYKKVHDHIDRFDHLGDETVNMVKMVNTKNDVRKVRNVRILKIITILSANFNSGRFNRPEMNIQRKKNRLASPAKRKRKKVIYHTNLTFSFTPTPLKIVH